MLHTHTPSEMRMLYTHTLEGEMRMPDQNSTSGNRCDRLRPVGMPGGAADETSPSRFRLTLDESAGR